MTRKDFIAIALAIKNAHSGNRFEDDYRCAVRMVRNLICVLRESNERFDKVRFVTACGVSMNDV